jgi:pyruvate-formate lyase-activating enzyme
MVCLLHIIIIIMVSSSSTEITELLDKSNMDLKNYIPICRQLHDKNNYGGKKYCHLFLLQLNHAWLQCVVPQKLTNKQDELERDTNQYFE